MRHLRFAAAGLALLPLATACTTNMRTYPEQGLTQLSGAAYSLPELRYDVSFVDTISGCPSLVSIDDQPTFIGSVAFNRKATATATYAAGERIAIDHAALTSIMKTSKYGFKSYESGVVKSINSGAEDQTGPLLKSVVSVALSAYGLVNPVSAAAGKVNNPFGAMLDANRLGRSFGAIRGFGGTPGDDGADRALRSLAALAVKRSIAVCKIPIAGALGANSKDGEALEKKSDALEVINAQVDALKLFVAAKAGTHDDLNRLVTAMRNQSAAKAALAKQKAEVEKRASGLSVTDELRWIPRGSVWRHHATPAKLLTKLEQSPTVAVLSDIAVANWWNGLTRATQSAVSKRAPELIKALGLEPGQSKDCTSCKPAPSLADVTERSGSILLLQTDSGQPPAVALSAEQLPDPKTGRIEGLVFREPVRMRLLICDYSEVGCGPVNAKSISAEQWVPQAGAYRLLPFRNRPFEAATVSADFREDGRMDSFSYERTKAPASGMDSLAESMIAVEAFRDKREKAAKEKWTESRAEELANLSHDIGLLTKEKELLALQDPGDQQKKQYEDETARLNAEIALLNAQRSKLEAEALLTAAAGG